MKAKPHTIDAKSGLTAQQLQFASAYLEITPCYNRGSQAAVKAGFAPKSARNAAARLMRIDAVAAYIRERENIIAVKLEEKQLVTAEWVVEQLKKVYCQSMVGEPQMVWENGELMHSGLWSFNDRGANKALELLGKTIKMFNDKADKATEPFNLNIILTEPEKPTGRAQVIEHQPQVYETPTINLEGP